MEFNPNNNIVKLCLQGIAMEDQDNPGEASKLFLLAWNKATTNFEKFLVAHYVSRHQENVHDKLKWLKTALKHALKANGEAVASAFPQKISGQSYTLVPFAVTVENRW